MIYVRSASARRLAAPRRARPERSPAGEVGGIVLNSLADFAGVSRSQLCDVFGRRKAASIDWLAKALGVPAWQLLAP